MANSIKNRCLKDDRVALDCELAAKVQREIWRGMRLGYVALASKLNDAGIETTFSTSHTTGQHFALCEMLAGGGWRDAMNAIYAIPLGMKRSDPNYVRRMDLRKKATKARLICFGSLAESSFGYGSSKNGAKEVFPAFLTSYAIFRVARTNQCFVHLFAFARPEV